MKITYATASEVGPRTVNEDAVAVWSNVAAGAAVAIADGLGGYHGGQQASAIAIRIFASAMKQEEVPDLRSVATSVHQAIRLEQQTDPKLRGMATTLTGAVIGVDSVRFVHCGDTRIALQRNSGIRRLTIDHTEAQRLLDAGAISREEYSSYPRKNVLESALGVTDSPRIDVGSHDLLPGDRLFFTTDGLHTKVFLQEMRKISLTTTGPDDFVKALVQLVKERGPEDNYSLAAVYVE